MDTSWMGQYTKKVSESIDNDSKTKFNHEEVEKSCEDIIRELNKNFEKNKLHYKALYHKEKNILEFPDNKKLYFDYLNGDSVIKFKAMNDEKCYSEFEITINSKNNKYTYMNTNYNSLYEVINKLLEDALK
ncbi:hypothetical protein [Clostridium sp. C2-6-12]|uniref:hypothetical protein n=1 Tax=Clostridium sp. C2-6-12 TaxID=2698832 RepID=UPI00136F8A8E|nr:hypothetical protein [Clostridium sp. C2-6-12]